MLNLAVAQRAQYFDNNLPAAGGRVSYYDVNTTILKPIYADPYGVIALPNPIILDINGMVPTSGVFYGEGNYTILVERLLNPGAPIPIYEEMYTVPDVPGSITNSPTSVSVGFISAVEDLTNMVPNLYDYVWCSQYYNGSTMDEGGGWFKWQAASTAPTDDGVIFSTTASPALGRWFRILTTHQITTAMYGVVSNKSFNMSSRISNAALYASSNKMQLVLSYGDIQCQNTFTVSNHDIVVDGGFRLVRLTSGIPTEMNLVASNLDIRCSSAFIDTNPTTATKINLKCDNQINIMPYWWGADNTGVANSLLAMESAVLSARECAYSPVFIDGAYKIQGTGITFSNLYFTKDSYIMSDTSIFSSIVTGKVDTEFGTVNIFRSTSLPTRWNTNAVVNKPSWFFDTTPTAAELIYMAECATVEGSKKGVCIWDDGSVYTLPRVADSAFMKQLEHNVMPGTFWNVGEFNPESTGSTWQIRNKVIYTSWFFNNDFQAALYVAVRNRCTIDGDFQEYITSIPFKCNYDINAILSLQNMQLTSDSTNQSILQFSGKHLSLNRVDFLNGQPICFGVPFEFQNCKFVGNGSTEFNIQQAFQDATTVGIINNCSFANYAYIRIGPPLLTFTNNIVSSIVHQMIFYGSQGGNSLISGNRFVDMGGVGSYKNADAYCVAIYTPSSLTFQNNEIQIAIPFVNAQTNGLVVVGNGALNPPNAPATGTNVCMGLYILNNFIRVGTNSFQSFITDDSRLIYALGNAGVGHYAKVENNLSNTQQIPGPAPYPGIAKKFMYQTNVVAKFVSTAKFQAYVPISVMLPYEANLQRFNVDTSGNADISRSILSLGASSVGGIQNFEMYIEWPVAESKTVYIFGDGSLYQ
jgi:hypothetical protein